MFKVTNVNDVLAKLTPQKNRPAGTISERDLETFKSSSPEFQRKMMANLKFLEEQGLIDPISQILEPLLPPEAPGSSNS